MKLGGRGFTENITAVLPVVSAWETAFETTQNRAQEMVSRMNNNEHVRRLRDRCTDAIYGDDNLAEVLRVVELAKNHLNTQGGIFNRYATRIMQTMHGAATTGLAQEIKQAENYYSAVLEILERDFCYGASVRVVESNTVSVGALVSTFIGETRTVFLENSLEFIANNGGSIAARIQPRNSLGHFVRSTNPARRWLGTNLRNGNVGRVAKGAKSKVPIIGGVIDGINYYRETGNVGRAISFGGFVAGLGLLTGGIVAAFSAPVLVVIGVGVVTYYGARWLYNNSSLVQNTVHNVGDAINVGINNVRNSIRNNNNTDLMEFEWV